MIGFKNRNPLNQQSWMMNSKGKKFKEASRGIKTSFWNLSNQLILKKLKVACLIVTKSSHSLKNNRRECNKAGIKKKWRMIE